MLEPLNVTMEPSNLRKKKKKKKEPLYVIKELSNVILELHNVEWNRQMWEKSKGTTKCEKRTVTCDVGPI